ncbi:RiPP maturation radical SAM C-methyltransferase [Amycolatopsis sp. YIM 10]|uniref:RiPP maturation radical SAM C-methyltransferase n=1 Tax=Amycolatopsis sp. YIM 10 TaxID=2653857 RepID=UPI0012A92114|nr:RiPP maturation radical SAM C-methyltransferase [Amycolatopsis sp. YIM 10]QFU88545.1 Ribosomal protein S12 methylthiotransferase RimO [Amycolatopsis sp. YIM 10]
MSTLNVRLAAMPWQALDMPSLPLGLLRASCRAAGREAPPCYHGNMHWAEFLLERSDGELGPNEYLEVAENGIFHGIGDFVFTGVLHGGDFGLAEFTDLLRRRGFDPGRALDMRPHAEEFIDLAAREILADEPDLVGFSSTFMQNVPSLALAARIKQYAPGVLTVLGGGNCDGPMGAALHRNYPCLDYVVRGEGEEIFPALLDAIERGAEPADLPGLCWRRDGKSVANPDRREPLPPGRIPMPDFDDWFELIESSPLEGHVQPKLVLESARGCWWGELHHCTFCGLNGSLMEFRSKAPERVLGEISHLVARHRTLDIIMVDNIIDNAYFTTLLPDIAALDWDLRIHYEVKANLTPAQIGALRDARVAHLQPGIESLSTRVLKLMDKGVDAIRNVRTLRDCHSAQLDTTWNLLFGFPGETDDDYWPLIRQLPALVHLQPPSDATPILLERFSPNFDRPELGFGRRRPAEIYRHVYDLPQRELEDLVYLFDSEELGILGEVVEALEEAIEEWKKRHHESSLLRVDFDGGILLEDRRSGWPVRDHHIEDPALVAAYRELEKGRSNRALLSKVDVPAQRLEAWLDELCDAGLVFREGDRFIALATTSVPVRIK